MKRFTVILVILLALAAVVYPYRLEIRDWITEQTTEPLPEPVAFVNTTPDLPLTNTHVDPTVDPETNTTTDPEPPSVDNLIIPPTLNLDVPFTSQSPFATWDEIHEDTCEEAALLMVHRYYQGEGFVDAQDADDELLALVDYQNEQYGDFKSTSAEETAQLIREYYGYGRVEVVYDITIDDVKRQVAQARPVILFAAGQQLGNPNFTPPGPLYHALVVKGWTETQIITNDPGTRKGADYVYDPDTLMDAVHDWNDGDPENGRRAMVVIYPEG